MGGIGSGRRGGKRAQDNARRLDIRRLCRKGQPFIGRAFTLTWERYRTTVRNACLEVHPFHVEITHQRRTGEASWENVTYTVWLSWTPCTYGGQRAWWLCPRCDRRVAILYDGHTFACRHCHQLSYRCQGESKADRAIRRVNKLRSQLGWPPGVLNLDGDKPAGMSYRKYLRLRAAYYRECQPVLEALGAKIGSVDAGLRRIRQSLAR
jgi:hypothetical protein